MRLLGSNRDDTRIGLIPTGMIDLIDEPPSPQSSVDSARPAGRRYNLATRSTALIDEGITVLDDPDGTSARCGPDDAER